MAGKRISELTEQTGLATGDFLGIDNAGETASKKIDQAYFTGQYSDMNNILGSKNLMPNNAVTVVLRGVTWTINSDGTIKANGTASGGDSTLYYVSSSNDATAGITIPEGKYTYTCLTSAGSDSTFRSEIYNLTNSYRIGWDYGKGVTFTRTAATKVLGSINIRSGQTVTNEIFKPMLRPAAVADPTYVPYAKSNKELTDDVATLNSSLTNLKWIELGNLANLTDTLNYPTDADTIVLRFYCDAVNHILTLTIPMAKQTVGANDHVYATGCDSGAVYIYCGARVNTTRIKIDNIKVNGAVPSIYAMQVYYHK